MGKPMDKARAAVSRMIHSGDHVLAAVSGGPDSVCLLNLLHAMKEEAGFDLSIAHLNHGARGTESDEDAEFVQRLGDQLGLAVYKETCDVKRERENLKTSFQDAARILRYDFLQSTLERIGANKMALGHSADDQVETLLMNLLRGSGLKGLGGMPETRDCIVRPLLECNREEILDYLRSRGLQWRTDRSNLKPDYLRNRIRLELIPYLKNYNPNVRSRLWETARILREDEALLADWTEKLFSATARPLADREGFEFAADRFGEQHPAMKKRLLRQAIALLSGGLREITASHIEEALQLFSESKTGKEIHLPGGITVRAFPESIRVEKNRTGAVCIQTPTHLFQPVVLMIPGTTVLKQAGIEFQTRVSATSASSGLEIPRIHSGKDRGNSTLSPDFACFDFEATGGSVQARYFKPGDRFVPLGMRGRKKVKSFFIDEKIPKESRNEIPILTTGSGDIIWIYGKRISETHRVTERTKQVLWIKGVEISGS